MHDVFANHILNIENFTLLR